MPSACAKMLYLTMEELEKSAPRRKTKVGGCSAQTWAELVSMQAPIESDLLQLYKDLESAKNRRPALLSLIPGFSNKFPLADDHLPPLLQNLYEPCNLQLDYYQLLAKVEAICSSPLSSHQVSHLEELTRGQASNHYWLKYRTGRITASVLHQVRLIVH